MRAIISLMLMGSLIAQNLSIGESQQPQITKPFKITYDDLPYTNVNKFLRDKNRVSNETDLNPNMGFLSSISDARIFLEKLYKSNDNKSS